MVRLAQLNLITNIKNKLNRKQLKPQAGLKTPREK